MRSRTALLVGLSIFALACEEPRSAERPVPSATEQGTPAGLTATGALTAVLPSRIGTFEASGEPESDVALGLAPTTRVSARYADGERHATLRVIDALRAPDLVAGFAAAQQLAIPGEPGATDELVPTGIAGRPALASWSTGTRTSEAQVVVAERFVVALTITPACVPEEAVDVLETFPFASLDALAR